MYSSFFKLKSICLLLCSSLLIHQAAQAFFFLDEEHEIDKRLNECIQDEKLQGIRELGNDCRILKVYNRAEVEEIERERLNTISIHCACQLTRMYDLWIESFFDGDASVKRIYHTVINLIEANPDRYPSTSLWSDVDVIVNKVSIYTATNEFFWQRVHNQSMRMNSELRKVISPLPFWRILLRACRHIARDKHKLYRYMENLQRVSPLVFYRLVELADVVHTVYTASKLCKFPMAIRLSDYQLQPPNPNYVVVDPSGLDVPVDIDNEVDGTADDQLRFSAIRLSECEQWQTDRWTFQQLATECPMMVGQQVPADWVRSHPSMEDRSLKAVECGCQLLMHNSTWQDKLRDPDVQTMMKALVTYMNHNSVPVFSHTPFWAIHAWFERLMAQFTDNRKMAIKEIVRIKFAEPNPNKAITSQDNEVALEIALRACNYVMLDYRKGANEIIDIKLINFLDNLQKISADPQFVLHLTLQDESLFKLHALSKMCEPFK